MRGGNGHLANKKVQKNNGIPVKIVKSVIHITYHLDLTSSERLQRNENEILVSVCLNNFNDIFWLDVVLESKTVGLCLIFIHNSVV